MLQSVRKFFYMLGYQPEDIKFNREDFTSETLREAFRQKPRKCPVIVAKDIFSEKQTIAHVMVATSMHVVKLRHKKEFLIRCKNTYQSEEKKFTQPKLIDIPLRPLSKRVFPVHGWRFGQMESFSAFFISIDKQDYTQNETVNYSCDESDDEYDQQFTTNNAESWLQNLDINQIQHLKTKIAYSTGQNVSDINLHSSQTLKHVLERMTWRISEK